MRRDVLRAVLPMILVLAMPAMAGEIVVAQDPSSALPPIEVDALDPARWSVSELVGAPGQIVRVTNRGVQPHTFAVREWGIDEPLPTLETIDVVIPVTAQPGDVVMFFCSEPGHRALGQEGTITIVDAETALAVSDRQGPDASQADRMVIETSDALAWSPNVVDAAAGQIIEVRNTGVLEHHFVVDDWEVNETVSAGEVTLIPVPDDVAVGQSFVFYCSVPGHRSAGMEGTLTIVEGQRPRAGIDRGATGSQAIGPDLDRFLPRTDIFGAGWSEVRTGNARAVLPDFDSVSSRIFPGEGRGATFIGPAGSRSTIIVLPFLATNAPTNQIEDAILTVQVAMMEEWEPDPASSAALDRIEPPSGCDIANRTSGITRVYTLPAGSTVCQLRSAGVAIFVAIEGQVGEWSGVEAADQIVSRLLQTA